VSENCLDEGDWKIDLFAKTAAHVPTGLIIRFAPAMDGSGAMTVDLVNPEQLEGVADDVLVDLPLAAWQVYAECSERALGQEGDQ